MIQFSGTFTQITWTNPVFENYYAFTVGITGAASIPTGVPEPATIAVSAIGLAALFLLRKLKRAV